MAGKQLRAEVILAGKEDGTFSALGNKLMQLGNMVNGMSQKIIDLGKESVETYKNYEDGILETRSVLQSQYEDTRDLNKVMASIEEHAQQWASSTIFHTDDIANSIANAAHAGWDYEKILQGIPSAMLIAQAGALDLSEGVDYLSKMLASTGTSFEESKGFVNEWAFASDKAATDIQQMGEAFLKLGAAGRLADSNEELFTMMTVLANVGTVGSDAGTAIRNVMARIAAPTQKASDAMEALGITEEEAAEALGDLDENSQAAYDRLREMGFDAYDEQGNLKGFIDIFSDMNILLAGMDEKSRNDFLKTLFGTKSFSYAMALLDAANSGELMSIYDAILGVKDSEYAQEKADTLMSGLTGSTELLMAKWEEFERKIGEHLAGPLETVQGILGGVVDKLNGMDPAILDTLISAFTVLGAAGPALIGLGGAFKVIGALGIGGAMPWVTLAAAFAGISTAVHEFDESNFASKFGTMELDTGSLMSQLQDITDAFNDTYAAVDEYNAAIETAITNYTTASSTLSSDLLTAMITGTQLTPEDKMNLQNLGMQMQTELLNGMNAQFDAAAEYLAMLGGADASDEQYSSAILGMYGLRDQLISEAASIGAELGEALGAAMDDGIITDDEYAAIMEKMRRYNEAEALATRAEAAGEMAVAMNKAQQVSYESLADFLQQQTDLYNKTVGDANEEHIRELARAETIYQEMIDRGEINPKTGRAYTEADWLAQKQWMNDQYDAKIAGYDSDYGKIVNTAFDSVMRNRGYADAWDFFKFVNGEGGIRRHAEGTPGEGQIDTNYYRAMGYDLYNVDDPNGLFRQIQTLATSDMWSNFAQGDWVLPGSGNNFDLLYDLVDAAWNRTYNDDGEPLLDSTLGHELFGETYDNTVNAVNEGNYADVARNMVEAMGTVGGNIGNFLSGFIGNYLMGGSANAESGSSTQQTEVVFSSNAAEQAAEDASYFADTIEQDVNVSDNGAGSNLRSSLVSMFSSPITQTVTISKSGGISKFAEGGRATEASIFGEAGAEWAIPEQHTERTAELLDSARRASGFTWAELIQRNGGLNAGGGGGQTVIYSPTINANDTAGIERVLMEDKRRLEELLREHKLRKEITSYA